MAIALTPHELFAFQNSIYAMWLMLMMVSPIVVGTLFWRQRVRNRKTIPYYRGRIRRRYWVVFGWHIRRDLRITLRYFRRK